MGAVVPVAAVTAAVAVVAATAVAVAMAAVEMVVAMAAAAGMAVLPPVANGAPVPAIGKIAAMAVATASMPAGPGAGAVAVVGSTAPKAELPSVPPFFQLARGSLQHLRACRAHSGVARQVGAPVTGSAHPFHHMHQVAADGPQPAAA